MNASELAFLMLRWETQTAHLERIEKDIKAAAWNLARRLTLATCGPATAGGE